MAFKTTAAALGLAGAAFAVGFGAAGTAVAQQAKGQPGWFKVCSEQAGSEICNVQFNRVAPNGRIISSVNLLRIKGKINREIFQIAVPSARFIPAGIKVRIDGGRENTIPYSICMPDRCLAETKLTDPLVRALKGGSTMTMVTTNFRNQKNPMEVTLKGFTKAHDGAPLKRDQLAQQQNKLKAELQKKAAATRAKLQEAQEKAKSGN